MYVCENSGSTNIHRKAWVNPNTLKLIEEIEGNDEIDNWCEDCQEHVLSQHGTCRRMPPVRMVPMDGLLKKFLWKYRGG